MAKGPHTFHDEASPVVILTRTGVSTCLLVCSPLSVVSSSVCTCAHHYPITKSENQVDPRCRTLGSTFKNTRRPSKLTQLQPAKGSALEAPFVHFSKNSQLGAIVDVNALSTTQARTMGDVCHCDEDALITADCHPLHLIATDSHSHHTHTVCPVVECGRARSNLFDWKD